MRLTLAALLIISLTACTKTQEKKGPQYRSIQEQDLADYLGLIPATDANWPPERYKVFSTKEEAKAWIDSVQLKGDFIGYDKVSYTTGFGAHPNTPYPKDQPPADEPQPDFGGGGGGGGGRSNMYSVSYSNWWAIVGFSTTFTWGYDDNGKIVAANFNGTMVGFYLGTGYEFKSASYTVDDKGVIHYDLLGMQTYGIMVEGMGLFLGKQSVRTHGTYNTRNGQHTSSYYPVN